MFNKDLFAKKLENLEPYKVDTNKYKARLDANESFISMPLDIREKFGKIIAETDFNRYPDPDATALCEAFADFYGINAENVAAGNGSDEVISILMNGFMDKGETVMTFAPDFSMYKFYAELAELKTVSSAKLHGTLQIDFDDADKTIKENGVKLVIFSNPCNPTGRIEKKSDIKALAEKNPGTIFIVDEAYMDFAGELSESESFLRDAQSYSNIIVLKTLSKALGSAALRLGFIIGDTSVINMFKAVKSPYNVNSVSQAFGEAVLREKDFLKKCIWTVTNNRKKLFEVISAQNLTGADKPSEMYTNFVFFESPKAEEIYTKLKEKGILIRCFKIGEGALRITAGNDEENCELLEAMRDILGVQAR